MISRFSLRLRAVSVRVAPTAGSSALAKAQGSLHIGGILTPVGMAVLVTHGPAFIAIPIVGSPTTPARIALFAVVFRTAQA